jgi:hypothetical protein
VGDLRMLVPDSPHERALTTGSASDAGLNSRHEDRLMITMCDSGNGWGDEGVKVKCKARGIAQWRTGRGGN